MKLKVTKIRDACKFNRDVDKGYVATGKRLILDIFDGESFLVPSEQVRHHNGDRCVYFNLTLHKMNFTECTMSINISIQHDITYDEVPVCRVLCDWENLHECAHRLRLR